jgi:uncharacterized protein (DUF305 family)
VKNTNYYQLPLKGVLAIALAGIGFLAACAPNNMHYGGDSKATANEQHGGMNHSMDLGPSDANYDLRFIDAMIPHHEGAIIMAKEALKKSKRPELKKLATEIITAQEKEIAEMNSWRKAWYPKASDTPMAWHDSMNHMMPMSEEQIKAMRMDLDLGAADAGFDKRFIDAMIPHHEAAVVMAKDVGDKSKRPQIQELAGNIITSQDKEIEQMKQWKQAWYRQ